MLLQPRINKTKQMKYLSPCFLVSEDETGIFLDLAQARVITKLQRNTIAIQPMRKEGQDDFGKRP
ncbi:hypothetical protein ADS79_13705 [Brevibacillus reuszeri]|uniref:Uncharacterized protein n=1 Tax=Brevibacillus reuszeri TaxID=54915 RepID=A0A0K9YVY9_9BACL|nr:hypothetical protein ADS79_13705 [Brevibacillus reuszeri]